MENQLLQQMIEQADRLYAAGQLAQASLAYESVLKEEPDHAWALSRTGAILAQNGDLEGAESTLTRALKIDPKLAAAHSNLGNVHFARGEYEAALTKYKEAIAINPDSSIYHQNLHAVYKKLGRITEAVTALKHSQRLNRAHAKDEAEHAFQKAKRNIGCLGSATILMLLSMAAVAAVLR